MKAGRELDKLIAEKVMGWRMELWPAFSELFPPNKVWVGDDANYKYYVENFKPSTNISDSWLVVEKLKGIHFSLHYINGKYKATFDNGEAEAENAPLAICLAALETVGGGNADV